MGSDINMRTRIFCCTLGSSGGGDDHNAVVFCLFALKTTNKQTNKQTNKKQKTKQTNKQKNICGEA